MLSHANLFFSSSLIYSSDAFSISCSSVPVLHKIYGNESLSASVISGYYDAVFAVLPQVIQVLIKACQAIMFYFF